MLNVDHVIKIKRVPECAQYVAVDIEFVFDYVAVPLVRRYGIDR